MKFICKSTDRRAFGKPGKEDWLNLSRDIFRISIFHVIASNYNLKMKSKLLTYSLRDALRHHS